jgi:hypothetical protein
MTPKANLFLSLHFRSRRFSLLLSGRTPFTCTRGLCLTWLETRTNQTHAQCSLTFTILKVVITSEASRAVALCLVTLLSLSNLLKSGLGSLPALGVGDMATVPQYAPSRPSCAQSVPDLTSPNTTKSLVCAVKHSPRQNLCGRRPHWFTPAPTQCAASTVVLPTVLTAAPALSGSTTTTSGCIPNTQPRR